LRRYDGSFEALVSIFQIMADFGQNLLHVPIVGALLAGGDCRWNRRRVGIDALVLRL
jgi:hypothetical protein